jgi:hypothetical protein
MNDYKVYLADARRPDDDDLRVVHVQHLRRRSPRTTWTTPPPLLPAMVKLRGMVDVVQPPAINRFRKPSLAPKFPRRASQEALQVLTRTLAAKERPLHTQELWDAIHQHFPQYPSASTTPPLEQIPETRQTKRGKLLIKPPLPPKADHVIRSKAYV